MISQKQKIFTVLETLITLLTASFADETIWLNLYLLVSVPMVFSYKIILAFSFVLLKIHSSIIQ